MTTTRLHLLCFLLTSVVLLCHAGRREAVPTTRTDVYFHRLLVIALFVTLFGAATAFDVGNGAMGDVSRDLVHLASFFSLIALVYGVYLYACTLIPHSHKPSPIPLRYVAGALFLLSALCIVVTMPCIRYSHTACGILATGMPVYLSFSMVCLYALFLGWRILASWRRVDHHTRSILCSIFFIVSFAAAVQLLLPVAFPGSIIAIFVPLCATVECMPQRLRYHSSTEALPRYVANADSVLPVGELIFICSAKGSTLFRMRASDLICLECTRNYLMVYLYDNGKIISKQIRQTMKTAEQIVAPYPYIIRVHRSFFVNMKRVKRLYSGTNTNRGSHFLQIEGLHSSVPVSRSRFKELKELLFEMQIY